MSIALLDVNVLLALFDPVHVDHKDTHRWLALKEAWVVHLSNHD